MFTAVFAGFILDIVFNPLNWLFIIFWMIYKKNKKKWAKIIAIIFTVIAVMALVAPCYKFLQYILVLYG